METNQSITNLLSEHEAWQESILGYRTELKLLNQDLSGIVSRHTPREVPAHAEHFQNQFILQKEVLDIMRHDFKQYENLLEANLEKPGKDSMDSIFKLHQEHQSRLTDFERLFNELKTEFNEFAQKNMAISA